MTKITCTLDICYWNDIKKETCNKSEILISGWNTHLESGRCEDFVTKEDHENRCNKNI